MTGRDKSVAMQQPDPIVPVGSPRRAFVVGDATETNTRLVSTFAAHGYPSAMTAPGHPIPAVPGDLVLVRLDVLPTLDGVESGLEVVHEVERTGATLLNRPAALLGAHDKLETALLLASGDVPHPPTVHVQEPRVPETLRPPYVIKPRFGSWGRDVFRCETPAELLACLELLAPRPWFRKQGAIVQELVSPTGHDLRVVVAAGSVVGAVERIAPPGEWRTNVALGAQRRPVEPDPEACLAAVRAAAAIGIDLAGIDLIAGRDGYVILEVNGAVDFTAEYGLSGSDPFVAAVTALGDAFAEPALATAT